MTVGERIKKQRLKINMSVDKLADLLGKNRATIYRYESDEIESMPTTILEPLANALQTTPSYLMGWDEGNRYFHLNLDFLLRLKEIDLSKLSSATNISIERVKLFLDDKEDPTVLELSSLANFFSVKSSDLLSKKMDSYSDYRGIYGDDGLQMFDYVEKNFGLGICQIVDLTNDLNFEGISKVIEYVEDLRSSDKYRKDDIVYK